MSGLAIALAVRTAVFKSFPTTWRVIGRHYLQQRISAKATNLTPRTFTSSSTLRATKWFYAVRKGRKPGVYDKWDDAKAQVAGFSSAEYQKFSTRQAAKAFLNGEPIAGAVSSPERLVVYTDGSYSSEGKGGFGAHFAADETPDLYERVPSFSASEGALEPGSNAKTELYAVLRVLESDPDASRELHFHCDSSYVVEAFNGRNGAAPSRRNTIKNRDLILYIQELIDNRQKAVKFFWVKGHAGIPGNVEADKLAAKATTLGDIPVRDLKADLEAYQARILEAKEKAKLKAKKKAQKAKQKSVDKAREA